jgi:hypothetical protein
MDNNVFINKDLLKTHFLRKHRKTRIRDMNIIHERLRNHLKPKEKPTIDNRLLKKWVNAHKKENRALVMRIIKNVRYISFKKFYDELIAQVKRFKEQIRGKKYILVIGVGSASGANIANFDIYKSNFWCMMLIWEYLKPYDIIFNLNTAIRLYYPNIKDYIVIDDASYSGYQLVENIIKLSSTELLYDDKDAYISDDTTNKTIYRPVQEKYFNVHLIVPFFSEPAMRRLNNIDISTGIRVIKYISYIIKPFGSIMDMDDITKIEKMYMEHNKNMSFRDLIPIYFEHKIADDISTIAIILIKGKVLDDKNKRVVFIKACEYDSKDIYKKDLDPKEPLYKKVYCPVPPYMKFRKLLQT